MCRNATYGSAMDAESEAPVPAPANDAQDGDLRAPTSMTGSAQPLCRHVTTPRPRPRGWLSIQRDGVEVARCKFVLNERPQSHPVLGEMPNGQLDILALEVAISVRQCGIGRETLRAIREIYPFVRLTALNDDAGSRGFWDTMGWVRHESSNPLFRSEESLTPRPDRRRIRRTHAHSPALELRSAAGPRPSYCYPDRRPQPRLSLPAA